MILFEKQIEEMDAHMSDLLAAQAKLAVIYDIKQQKADGAAASITDEQKLTPEELKVLSESMKLTEEDGQNLEALQGHLAGDTDVDEKTLMAAVKSNTLGVVQEKLDQKVKYVKKQTHEAHVLDR